MAEGELGVLSFHLSLVVYLLMSHFNSKVILVPVLSDSLCGGVSPVVMFSRDDINPT